MSTGTDLKAREGGIPNDSNLNMTQEQSFKKGKNGTHGTLVMREIGDSSSQLPFS